MKILKALLKGFGITFGVGSIVSGFVVLLLKLASLGAIAYFGAVGVCLALVVSVVLYMGSNDE